ncbi:MAG: uridine kinase [Gemmatimonadales bacterium]|nr:uridine kinase [Gemmatimonadales bacterium]
MTHYLPPYLVAVAGGSGSGKTTVARALVEAFAPAAVLLDQDSYYRDQSHLPLSERAHLNFDHPDAIETALLADHLARLRAGLAIDKPVYDFAVHGRTPRTERVEPRALIVVDGILLLAVPPLREAFDLRLFVDVSDDIRFIRRLLRDIAERGRSVENIVDQYLETVRPMHLQFVEPSRRYADLVLTGGGGDAREFSEVSARIAAALARRACAAGGLDSGHGAGRGIPHPSCDA